MKKSLFIAFCVLIVVIGSVILWQEQAIAPTVTDNKQAADYKNISYTIDNKTVTLVNGIAETNATPGSDLKTITNYFGNEVRADFNADGREDVAFLLTQDTGGSGTFVYIAAALGTQNGYTDTNTVLLGDRVAPQTTEFRDGEIIVNYADRKPGEPMATPPSVGVSKYFKVSGDTLTEILK
ncbi:MAG: hypothetical protein A3B30_01225 [Candidatus Komeilibacteria bacterium RIFCSPLOWO2_01_FULL_52_15]|uniref:Uncharacterized protein n=2 Tax=Candidatus Komeiliibacteriota TaxID=1817908 RepID=A0A1G2BRF6_9BACT|nr:MAG: hypothetical protein A2677_00995 [Candidatus Komeilibacteria bacterium RIFCSPHIGHO2_01_FULL_52_14]OGY90797.1 MAG: hypothetical protein A3B30_01225 [Candidatus Komeilibacteria bacterium RIFCSPLOWO2_01_FULL_52_15]